MKTGVKSIELKDYIEVQAEVDQLKWLAHEFQVQCPTARIDTPLTLSHGHKWWEWARALKLIDTYAKDKSTPILDIGAAYSLLGPALAYKGYRTIVEVEPSEDCIDQRRSIQKYLFQFNQSILETFQLSYGQLVETTKNPFGQFGVVLSISTIEHVDLWLEKTAWKEMADLTKPGGLLIVTMDVMSEARKGFAFDDCRWTNYSMDMVRDRVNELKSYGFEVIGDEDYTFHGALVNDYSFASVHMRKKQ